MTPVLWQATAFDDPRGPNVLRCCVASILDIDIGATDGIPDPGLGHKAFIHPIGAWGGANGYEIGLHDEPPSGYSVAIGPCGDAMRMEAKRQIEDGEAKGENLPHALWLHAVVALDGELVFDPCSQPEGDMLSQVLGYVTVTPRERRP